MVQKFEEFINTFSGGWELVTAEWLAMNDRFLSEMDDFPPWYSEASNMAMLSSAIWKAGGLAAVEFHTERYVTERKSNGLVDGEFRVGDKNYWVEAKFVDARIPDRQGTMFLRHYRVGKAVGSACTQLKQCDATARNYRRSCIFFFAGSLSEGSTMRDDYNICRQEIEDRATKFQKGYFKEISSFWKRSSLMVNVATEFPDGPGWADDWWPMFFGCFRLDMD
jgi:hypothetical protein